jgi:preprotein translocase SecE subunit
MSTKASGSSARGTTDASVRSLRLQAFLQGLASEMRRVTWPTRREWISATLLTIGLVVCLGLYTYGVDMFFRFVFHSIHPTDQP